LYYKREKMSPLLLSIANVLVTEMANQAQYSSSLVEVGKILAISSAWIGGLILWMRSKEKASGTSIATTN
jgi:hypothetical protein